MTNIEKIHRIMSHLASELTNLDDTLYKTSLNSAEWIYYRACRETTLKHLKYAEEALALSEEA